MNENITLTADERTELNQLRAFKEHFERICGQGYDIVSWEGKREPFEEFYHNVMAECNKSKNSEQAKTMLETNFAEYKISCQEEIVNFYKNDEKIAEYSIESETFCYTYDTQRCMCITDLTEAIKTIKEVYDIGQNPLWIVYSDMSGHLEIGNREVVRFDGATGEVKFEDDKWELAGKNMAQIKEHIYNRLDISVDLVRADDKADKEISFENTIDETAEIMTENGKVNVMLALTDDKYDAILNRTTLLTDAGVTFREAVEESEVTFNVYVDFYPDGNIEMFVFMQSDDYGWKDAEVSLSDTEKAQLCDDLERVAQCRYHATTKELMKKALDNIDLEGVETFSIDTYQENKNMAFIINNEIYTVNVIPLPPYTACIDINNNPDALRELQEKEYAIATGDTVSSGFVDYPVVVFNVKKLEEMYNGEVKDYEEKAHVTHADHQKAIIYYNDIVSAQKSEKDNGKETIERE